MRPQGGENFLGQIAGESCKCTPRQRVHPEAEKESNFSGNWGDVDGVRCYLGGFSVCFEGDD